MSLPTKNELQKILAPQKPATIEHDPEKLKAKLLAIVPTAIDTIIEALQNPELDIKTRLAAGENVLQLVYGKDKETLRTDKNTETGYDQIAALIAQAKNPYNEPINQ